MNMTTSIRTIARGTVLAVGISALSLPALAAVVSPGVQTPGAVATKATHSTTQVLPPALRPVFYRALAKDAGTAYDVNAEGCATLQELTGCFNDEGARFSGAASLALHLVAFGRGEALGSMKAVQPVIEANRVSYVHGNLTEWWRVLPIGFEQGFTIAKRPAGHGNLTLALAANGRAGRRNGALGWGKLRYGQLVVTDAKGKVVPATLKSQGGRILIAVNDAHAAYPLTVDPLVWLEQEVTASDGTTYDWFGWSVAIEGNTALVGAPTCGCNGSSGEGSAYVFTRNNGTWTETQKLTGNDVTGETRFGWAVALDGTTAMIGATFTGAVYVFAESDGVWTQTQKLVPSDPENGFFFGTSIAMNGATAIVGSPFANAAYVFNATNGTWSQTQKLTASDGEPGDEFGISIALDGSTALIGAFAATVNGNTTQGAAYVFNASNGTWSQAQKLVANDGAADDEFGISVALESSTALIGAYHATTALPFTGQGAVYVFGESGGAWNQSQKLTVSIPPGGGGFGESVALDGDTAVISANNAVLVGNTFEGAAYVFENSGGTWNQSQELVASDGTVNDFFGGSYNTVALQNGTALIGAYNATVDNNSERGKAYFYGESNLGLNVSAPQTVGQGQQYVSQTIATNNASAASPAVTAIVTVPAAASFVSASASQGTCSEDSGVVACDFGQISGNAGMATANVTLKATGNVGDTIDNTASIAKATPPLSASTPTAIITGGACPDGYTEYDGSLNPGEVARSPVYQAPSGSENAILTAPERFELYAVYQSGRFGQHAYLVPGNEVHRWGPKGLYMWLVRARDGAGAYTLCLMHP